MGVVESMDDFGRVEFILVYGSSAEGRAVEGSDIDFCVYYVGSEEEQSRFRMRLLGGLPSNFDVQIFQRLPLYVRKEVLRGKEVYVRDREFMYDVALQSIREYDLFRPYLMDYVGG
ncbi:MAG: nucleotidyltransferase domain-containing protein [Candidatus Altiarchaeota archaeon]|nr:nucleotidyltransferase domain-containing protein [Candidatus Altiarchaeota archaeon]